MTVSGCVDVSEYMSLCHKVKCWRLHRGCLFVMPQEATGGQTVGDGIQDTSLTGVMPAGAVTIHPSQYPSHLQVALASLLSSRCCLDMLG